MKKIAILTLAAALFAGASSFAQDTASGQTAAPAKCEKACHKKCARHADEFAGITLTPEQQAKVEALKAEYRKDIKGAKAEMGKAQRKGNKMVKKGEQQGENLIEKAKAKGEKIAEGTKDVALKVADGTKAEVKKLKGEGADRREKMSEKRAEYLQKMKEILTPEQYTTYLENIAKANPHHGDKARMAKAHKAQKVKQAEKSK